MNELAWWKRRTRQMWKRDAHISIYPTGRGTWTVHGLVNDPSFRHKRVTNITSEEEFQQALYEVRVWLNAEVPDVAQG